MITINNFSEVLKDLSPQEIDEAINGKGNYVKLELCIFNVGFFAMIESTDYDEEAEEECNASGNLFLDKDDFLRLLKEYES
jgi:hypothetical protein